MVPDWSFALIGHCSRVPVYQTQAEQGITYHASAQPAPT